MYYHHLYISVDLIYLSQNHPPQGKLGNEAFIHISGFLKHQEPGYQIDKQKNSTPFPSPKNLSIILMEFFTVTEL